MGEDTLVKDPGSTDNKFRIPIKEFWEHYRLTALKVILISWSFGVSVYLIFIFLPSYLHTFHNMPLDKALSAHTITLIVLMVMIPGFGIWSDKIGRKALLIVALTGFTLFSYPLFRLLFETTFEAILGAMLAFAVLEAMFQAALPALLTELFPARVRYTGLSVSYNISMAIFGGTTPLVCTWLVHVSGGNVWMPAYYLIATTIIALLLVFTLPETAKKPLQ